MAIAKWISSFATTQPAATPVPAVVQQPPIIPAADAKLFGLENFGNTCYANSVLQALYFCSPFRDLLLQYPDASVPDVPSLSPPPLLPIHPQPHPPHTEKRKRPVRGNSVSEIPSVNPNLPPAIPIPPSPPTLLSALRSLYLHISSNPAEKGTVAPHAFIQKLKDLNELFRGSMHQDAHEFLNFLLNKIMEDMEDDGRKSRSSTNGIGRLGEDLTTSVATLATQPTVSTSSAHAAAYHSTIVHRLFEGVLTSETRCLTCETVSSRDESFLDLSIDIEQNSSVTACLRQFSASEMLCQKNKFFCDSCCDLQEAEKRMKIKKLPNVLALHLKRFKYQEDVGKYIKLAYRVAFPLELRLFNTVDDAEDPDRLYELFAIVVHIGTGPHHGHYVTIIKTRGTWTLFDDDTVSPMKESDIPKYFGDSSSGSAYVLYYQAVDLDLPALGLKSPTPPPTSTVVTDIDSTPNKSFSLATGEPSEQGHVPSSPAPAIPPGLAEDTDLSDKSDSPIPIPMATAQTPPTPPKSPDPDLAPIPNLIVHIPPSGAASQTPPDPSLAQTQPELPAQHSSNGNTLRNLYRRTPSLKLKSSSNQSTPDNSTMPSAPSSPSATATQTTSFQRPPTTQSIASTTETSSFQTHETLSVPPSPIPPKGHTHLPNSSAPIPAATMPPPPAATPTKDKDKERHLEKKPSAWSRLMSSRQDVSSLASPRLGRRGSEAAISHPSSPILTSSPSPVPSLPPFASSSRTDSSLPSSPTHKKSSPEISRSVKREKRSSGNNGHRSAQEALPPRPSTAGARMGGSLGFVSGSKVFGSSRPTSGAGVPPPLPPLPGSPTSHGEKVYDADASANPAPLVAPSSHADSRHSYNGKGNERDASHNRQRDSVSPLPRISQSNLHRSITHSHSYHSHSPSQSYAQPQPPSHTQAASYPFASPPLSFGGGGGGSIADTPVVPPSGSSHSSGSSSGAGNWKRATRKLSFTAPMLGFGRKNKDPATPPSTFAR